MKLKRDEFGCSSKGEKLFIYTLLSDSGVVVKITNYGATITSIETPDREGNNDHIALGFENLEQYISEEYISQCPYFGCAVGRYANRIASGKIIVADTPCTFAVNNGPNSLHGGVVGFDKKVWVGSKIEQPNEVGVSFKYRSVDGEEGYPGNLDVVITYLLNRKGELSIEYGATTDKTTVLNLTNHTYFNLTGCATDIKGHTLEIMTDRYTESDSTLIPTGNIVSVDGTPYDFTTPETIGSRIDDLPDGYDLNFVLGDGGDKKMIKAARLSEPKTGRVVEVETTQPGIQLYTGYYIPELTGHNGAKYGRYMGVALETQHFADSPNKPNFPTTILNPEEKFLEKTIYRFSVDK